MKGVGGGVVTTDGLYFIMDALNLKSGTSTAIDIANEKSYTLSNGTYNNGRSFVFDGIDDYISVGALGSASQFTSFTLDLWFNSSSIVNYRNILDFNGMNTGIRIEQYTYPGYLASWANLGYTTARMSVLVSMSNSSIGINDISENTWNNLIVKISISKLASVYLNGVLICSNIYYSSVSSTIGNMRIGDGYDYSSRRFQGQIPYVAIYDRELSDSECLNNYNTLKWRFI